ncbi:dihydrofolate reductase family protein [Nonomuraea basaltis]|uniref:dihydrofolate reductase family protein n=1 Tax=Nonomuraea basaltis TaxID=2495887 RepID=UPI00110C612C|nr:dihydrofolate reductase family protein [Nonomuraea basaltis]TMR88760.1 dihydrofolate reductase [Nonomuraea basaltis]
MGKLIYWVHTSVDGHINGPEGEFDWPGMGPELSAYGDEIQAGVGTFLYGRVVWEMMSGFWPQAESMSDHPHDLKFAPIWRRTPKVVFSSTLKEAGWNTRIMSGNLAEEVTELKREADQDLLLNGGSRLASALTELGLIDEYHIMVHPVVLGGGQPLFLPQKDRVNLRLADSRTFDARTALLRYERS